MFWRNLQSQFDITSLDEKTRRDVYQQMRKIANKRIDRGGGWGTKNTPVKFKSMTTLVKESGNGKIPLREVQRVFIFVSSKETLPSERKKRFAERDKKIIEKLKQHGVMTINSQDDLKKFGEFMDAVRSYMNTNMLDALLSDEMVDIYEYIEEMDSVDFEKVKEHIDRFIKHSKELSEKIRNIKENGGEGKSSKDVNKRIKFYANRKSHNRRK